MTTMTVPPKTAASRKRNNTEQTEERVGNDRPAKDLQYFMGLDYPVEMIRDEGIFVASHPDLPGCVSMGDTPNEAIDNLAEVRQLWLEGQLANGNTIPEPSKTETFSGKFVLRVPKLLHRLADNRARQEGVSLNSYIASVLAGALNYPLPQGSVGEAKFFPMTTCWVPVNQDWAINVIGSGRRYHRSLGESHLASFIGNLAGRISDHSKTSFNPAEIEDYHRAEEESYFTSR